VLSKVPFSAPLARLAQIQGHLHAYAVRPSLHRVTMREFVTEEWRALAAAKGLTDFDAVWQLEIGWFEEPNKRRGGWSGVSRFESASPESGATAVFVKRQQNHVSRTWRHPLRGITTFRREFENLQWLQDLDIPTLDVLYFAERVHDGDRQAILITRELTGYVSFQDYQLEWLEHGLPEPAVWRKLLYKLADIAQRMHLNHVQHNCLMPKHVFISHLEGEMDIRVIDLEKAKRSVTVRHALFRDLDTFNRRAPCLSTSDRLRFLLAYCGEKRVNSRVRAIWKRLGAMMERKSGDQQDVQEVRGNGAVRPRRLS